MRRPSQVGRLVPPLDRPGCVLLDLRMPGASGLELQAALTRRGVALPVIFLTDHGDVASSVRAMQAGAADYLKKPVKRDTLFEVLRRALEHEVHVVALVPLAKKRLAPRAPELSGDFRQLLEHLVAKPGQNRDLF